MQETVPSNKPSEKGLSTRRIKAIIAVSFFCAAGFFLFSSEFLSSIFSNKLDKLDAGLVERILFSFKPTVVVVFFVAWFGAYAVTILVLRPLFTYLNTGKGYDKARIATLKFPWVMMILQDVFWVLGSLGHTVMKNWQPDSGVAWPWVLAMKFASGHMSALLCILIVNVLLMRIKLILDLKEIRSGERDLFSRNKDVILFVSLALFVVVNTGYLAYYFMNRQAPPDMGLLNAAVIGTAAVIILISLFIIALSKREYFFQVNLLKEKLRQLRHGQGDISQRILLINFDEVGELAHSFNRFLDNLEKNISILADMTGKISQSSNSLSSQSEILNKTYRTETESTEQISQIMQNLSQDMQEVTRNVERQTERIAGNASSAAALSESSARLAEKMGQVHHEIGENQLRADEGIAKVKLSIDTSLRMNKTLKALSEQIEVAGSRTQEISAVLATISDIADRTNLLSINASIEAAHAGERGKGFIIVAQEIRKLAELSAQSAARIAELLSGINEIVLAGSDLSRRGAEESEDNQRLSSESGRALGSIVESVNAISRMISEVNGLIASQDQVAQDFLDSTRELAASASNIRTAVESQARATTGVERSLEILSGNLRQSANLPTELGESAGKLSEIGTQVLEITRQFSSGKT